LLNSVYNRHQFWDGRVSALEEVLVRQLDDEHPPSKETEAEQSAGYRHVWPGLIARLRGKPGYVASFLAVFGTAATEDNVAKALATYMRTLLDGDSIFDRAEKNRKTRGGKDLEASDFQIGFTAQALKQHDGLDDAERAARLSARGWQLFAGRGGCAVCHLPPLLTDLSFHNVGDSVRFIELGAEKGAGRVAVVPYGLKHRDQIGAYKTPSLRGVSETRPYMHDGSLPTLRAVLAHFDGGLDADGNRYLDPMLLDVPFRARRPYFDAGDLEALELFLRCLRGTDLPDLLTRPSESVK
jgi:cytochrome c peroxidase